MGPDTEMWTINRGTKYFLNGSMVNGKTILLTADWQD